MERRARAGPGGRGGALLVGDADVGPALFGSRCRGGEDNGPGVSYAGAPNYRRRLKAMQSILGTVLSSVTGLFRRHLSLMLGGEVPARRRGCHWSAPENRDRVWWELNWTPSARHFA